MNYRFSLLQTSPDAPRAKRRRTLKKRMTPSRRAAIAAQIVLGEKPAPLTVRQACRLTGASATYVYRALAAYTAEREEMAQGKGGMSHASVRSEVMLWRCAREDRPRASRRPAAPAVSLVR